MPQEVTAAIAHRVVLSHADHYVTGKDMDFLGLVGAILLIGVVVNNGIVLIDYVIRLRAEGMERARALVTASARRFRPIAMTALTTIIGMIPLTFPPPSRLGISYKSFGLTLIGGMTTATIFTLLVVPIFYTFFDDARLAFVRILRRAVGRKPVQSERAPGEGAASVAAASGDDGDVPVDRPASGNGQPVKCVQSGVCEA